MAHIKVWVHFVWTTKKRRPLLVKPIKGKLLEHIRENARKKDIYIDSIDGGQEHLHLLISMGGKQSVSEIARLLKGESSFWINDQRLVPGGFKWQKEYFAVSVNESALPRVRNYIRNQEDHHRMKSFGEEYSNFLQKYGFQE